ncbi:MAG: YceI family protein [Lentisphaerae bacterium]|nr:YceI family protein [Lentisphaerota bacterium]
MSYEIDATHSSVDFKIRHLGISWVRGSFTDFAGTIEVDSENVKKSSIEVVIQATSVDTRSEGRDKHLRTADFFNVEAFPTITFKSTGLRKRKDGTYTVAGNLTMLGKSRKITAILTDAGEADGMKGEKRRGGELAELVINRSDFGMGNMVGPIGDDVHIFLSFEAVKK